MAGMLGAGVLGVLLAVGPTNPRIIGGEEVPECGWPSVVFVEPGCTGTLIHPRVVLTAAHCITNDVAADIKFGHFEGTARQLATTETCRASPGWNGTLGTGEDYAYCLLSEPVLDVPIVPVAGACEQTAIRAGSRLMHVGFGRDQNGNAGRKKMLDTTIGGVSDTGEIFSGETGALICFGDSGGPAFVYLDPELGGDGSWRVAGIHSYVRTTGDPDPQCIQQGGSVSVANAIEWIEDDSGIDITPCSNGGEWEPMGMCRNIPLDPWDAEGETVNACTHSSAIEFPAMCGPGLQDDADAPVVEVLSPALDEVIDEGQETPVSIAIDAQDEGWGVSEVQIVIRSTSSGQEQTIVRDAWSSWTLEASLPGGTYEVQASATDYAGNTSEPTVVCFGVGESGCPEEEAGSSSSGGGEGDSGTGVTPAEEPLPGTTGDAPEGGSSTGAEAGASDGSGGCGCAASPASSSLAFWLIPLLWRRRTGRAVKSLAI